MSERTGNTTHIQHWINKGTYICPGCQYRISGVAWSVAKLEYTCPRCGKRHIREFKREHK